MPEGRSGTEYSGWLEVRRANSVKSTRKDDEGDAEKQLDAPYPVKAARKIQKKRAAESTCCSLLGAAASRECRAGGGLSRRLVMNA